jgi:phosphonate degradation associated HDIG domain protein
MTLTLPGIDQLFARQGQAQYEGEPVTQLAHALQCAALAEADGADDELVTAALLHDLGHLLHDLAGTPTLRSIDDVHQYRALPGLHGLFGTRVTDPIRLHVDAKRYLCAVNPSYFDALSADSRRSLSLQGGVFSGDEARTFMGQRGAARAVQLRRWDDQAKSPGAPTPPLAHYLQRAARCASPR